MTPKHLLKKLRQRRDLESDDSSLDEKIEAMPPMEKLREVVAWELGSPEWADDILRWAYDLGAIEYK